MAGYETAIVQLCSSAPGMPTVGMGMLVGDDQVVTCAHVVNTALGRDQREQACPGEQDWVHVAFPQLPGVAMPPVRLAQVTMWLPPESSMGGGDVAGLLLTEKAPDGATPARFAAVPPDPGTSLRVFGYPGFPLRETGSWVDVELKGAVGGQLIQVESRGGDTVKAQPGYSGSPVWAAGSGEAVGLLEIAPPGDEPEHDAYLLKPAAIAAAWEAPFDYLLIPESPYRGWYCSPPSTPPVFRPRRRHPCARRAGVRAAGDHRRGAVGCWQVLAGASRSDPRFAATTAVDGGASPAGPRTHGRGWQSRSCAPSAAQLPR